MKNEIQETISIQGKGNLQGKTINVVHSSSLMTNYESAHIASPGQRINSVTDSNGNPMVFTISENDGDKPSNLYLTYRDETQKTGWKQLDLTDTLPKGGGKTQSFSVSQYVTGQITIAIVFSVTATGESSLYISTQLSDNPSSSDWVNLKDNWMERPCPISGIEITSMDMTNAPSGVKSDGNGPLLFVAGKLKGKLNYYTVGSGVSPAKTWPVFTPPDKATSVTQVLSGLSLSIGAGTFALYNNGQGMEVAFQGVPNESGVSQKYTLDVDNAAQSIAVSGLKETKIPGMGTIRGNGLFVGGTNGVTYFDPSSLKGNATGITVIGKDKIAGAKEITVTESSSEAGLITIWAIDDNNNLVYACGDKSAPSEPWTGPFIFKQNVAQIAPIQNHTKETSEVIVVGLNGKMSYLWQDPISTLWQESNISLYTTSELIDFTCYTTEANFSTADGTPIQGDFKLTSSTWAYATINGEAHILTPSNLTTVSTGPDGQLTIIMKVESISVPNFNISSDDLSSAVHLVPFGSIAQKLKSIKSGSDLQNAKDQITGKPIFTGTPKIPYDAAAKAIQKLTSLHTSSTLSGGKVSTAAVESHADYGNSINVLAHTGTWGLKLNADGTMAYVEGPHAEAAGIFSDIFADAGDALRWLEHSAEEVEHFVVKAVDDTVHFIIKIGNDVVNFVVKTAEQIYAAVSFVLKKIGALIEDIIKWIGFLFEWEDILETKDVFSAYTLKGLEFAVSELVSAETTVTNFFDGLKGELQKSLQLQPGMPKGSIKGTVHKQQSANTSMKTPGGHFSSYHTKNSGMLSGAVTDVEDVAQEILDWIKGTLTSEIDSVEDDLKAGVKQILNLFHSGDFTLENFFKILLETVVDLVLDTLKNICVSALKLGEIIVGIIKKALTANIDIPFLSSFYKSITGHQLTLLDGMSLLLAIPTTIVYKIGVDKAPFASGSATTIQNTPAKILFSPSSDNEKELANNKRAVASVAPAITNITEAKGAVKVYQDIGVIVSGICGLIGTICYIADEASEDEMPMVPKIQLGCSVVAFAMTFPATSGPAQAAQGVQWGVSGLQAVADGIDIKKASPVRPRADKVFAGIGVLTSIVDAVLGTVAFGINAASDEGVSVIDGVGYGCLIVNDVAGVAQGIGDLDPEPDTKAIAVLVGSIAGVAGGLGEIEVGIAAAKQ
jgi:hypothetical protein